MNFSRLCLARPRLRCLDGHQVVVGIFGEASGYGRRGGDDGVIDLLVVSSEGLDPPDPGIPSPVGRYAGDEDGVTLVSHIMSGTYFVLRPLSKVTVNGGTSWSWGTPFLERSSQILFSIFDLTGCP